MYKQLSSCYRAVRTGSALLGAAGLLASSMAYAAIDGSYLEDFEDCTVSDLDAIGLISGGTCLIGAELSVGANVFDTTDTIFQYFYGLFPAPNNGAVPTAQFTGLAVAEGGANQGLQQLNFFNDYANADHTNSSNNVIHALVLKEWIIDAADLDKTWVFRYSYKSGDAPVGTTKAFISTIETFSGSFFQTNLVDSPTDDRTGMWVEDLEISLFLDSTIDDVNNTTGAAGADGVPDLQGQIFQIGMENTAANLSPSGMFYDNLAVFEGAVGCVNDGLGDADTDGVDDNCDNCTIVANPLQIDVDNDGHGNICDADFDNDCAIGFTDLTTFSNAFFGSDPLVDLDSDGAVGFTDLTIFSDSFFGAPGPSAIVCVP